MDKIANIINIIAHTSECDGCSSSCKLFTCNLNLLVTGSPNVFVVGLAATAVVVVMVVSFVVAELIEQVALQRETDLAYDALRP